jgi:hypothetical protein
MVHWARAGLGVRLRRQAVRLCTTSRTHGVPTHYSVTQFSLAPFNQPFLNFSQLKWSKV